MRAVIYTRVSSDPKAQSQSVQSQEAECRRECERNGWDVAAVFSDNDRGASRHSKGERKEHAKLLAFLARGEADVLVMWESSRAQRGLAAYVDLRAICASAGVKWSYKGKLIDLNTADGMFNSGLDALLDERESEVVRERVQRGVNAHIASGKPYGKVPYGYYREYDDKRALVGQFIREDQAEIIRECARRFLAGEAPNAIAKDLDARGVPTPRATATTKGWCLSQIRKLLTSPTYNGKRTHNGVVTGEGQWQAILDDATYKQCVMKFADPSRKTTSERSTKYLLTGIAKCGECGGVLKKGVNRTYPSYQCKDNWCVTRKLDALDEYVTAMLMARLKRPDFLKLLANSDAPDVSEAVDRYNELKAELAALELQAETDDIPINLLAARQRKIEAEMRELEPLLTKLEAPTSLRELAERPEAIWEALTINQKRECLRYICDIRVMRTGRGKRTFDPAKVNISFGVQTAAPGALAPAG